MIRSHKGSGQTKPKFHQLPHVWLHFKNYASPTFTSNKFAHILYFSEVVRIFPLKFMQLCQA